MLSRSEASFVPDAERLRSICGLAQNDMPSADMFYPECVVFCPVRGKKPHTTKDKVPYDSIRKKAILNS